MKNILFRFFLLFLSFNSFSNNNEKIEIIDFQNTEISQDWYSITATTRNTSETNYSLSFRVQGYYEPGITCISVTKVKVRISGSWKIVSHYSVEGENCTYFLNVEGNSYYFTI
ncbi:hypothetical protein N8263_03225 [Flavobacteriaceae bacterium]|nr:hypothetical protein [Flavobacteriaceae bacterium]|tara:strand:+ start:571 stop:909 length:339 start_codon:yes stop_codon:yes gene_type:complete